MDMWSKTDHQPFYAMTAHWISSNLKLATRLIAFHRFWGHHTAQNLAEVTIKLLDRVQSTAKVSHQVSSQTLFLITL
jgi:hypothetical protein